MNVCGDDREATTPSLLSVWFIRQVLLLNISTCSRTEFICRSAACPSRSVCRFTTVYCQLSCTQAAGSSLVTTVWFWCLLLHGSHPPGKPGKREKVREFDIGQGKVRENRKSPGKVGEIVVCLWCSTAVVIVSINVT